MKNLSNPMSEKAVISGLIRYGSQAYFDIVDIITPDCFTEIDNVILFKCISEVLGTTDKVDITTVISKGSSLGIADEITKLTSSFKELKECGIDFESVRNHAKIIRKLEIARKAQSLVKKIYNELQNVTGEESIDSILARIESPIINFSSNLDTDGEEKTVLLGEGIEEHVKNLIDNPDKVVGIPTPWPTYNSIIGGGLRKGSVYLMGARPGTGKSTLAKNECIHYAGMGVPVLYLDTEMRRPDQINRFLSTIAQVKISDVEDGSFSENSFQKIQILESAKIIGKSPIYYRNIAGKKFEEVLSILRRWLFKDVGLIDGQAKNCVVIYDYFKLMDSSELGKMQEHQVMGFQINELSNFCIKFGIPCSAYVQQSREMDVSQSDRLLWLCSSCSFFEKKTQEEIAVDGIKNGNMKLIIKKSRFGPEPDYGDYINIAFNRDIGLIKELKLKSQMDDTIDVDGFEIND